MIYLAYIIFGFAIIQLAVALANLLFRQNFAMTKTNYSGLVSVLIPARNEETNIGNLLSDLLNQDYKNIEILVFNDQSSDRTAEIVTEFQQKDSRVRLIHSEGLPNGWLGKNFACYSLSKHARGEYFLFLDADVRIGNNVIADTIDYSTKYNLGLLSIFPKQIMMTIGEHLTVPIMNYILLSLLPLILVRKLKNPSLAAANGQFMLFNSTVYREFNPHEKVKAQKVEDIEIARYFKKNNLSVACLVGNNSIKCKMYAGFTDAVNGFAKNITSFFGKSFLVAILFWLVTTFGFIAVYTLLGSDLLVIYLLITLITRTFIWIVSKQNIFWNLMLLIPQQIVIGQFIYKAIQYKIIKQHQWKGRNIL
jgi:glycosyltransferase involved in cell wall biosynthesis